MSGLSPIPKMAWIACAAACFIAASGGVCAQQQGSGTANEKTVLRGTVVNSLTGQPVGRAVVKSTDGRFAVMTNERGRFEMVFKEKKNAPPGTPGAPTSNAFFVSGNGNMPLPNTAVTPDGQFLATSVDRPDAVTASRQGFIDESAGGVVLERDQEEVTLTLTPEAHVVGHVVFADGEGAEGMQVMLYRRTVQRGQAHWIQVQAVQARSDGEFRFAGLLEGTYKLFSGEQPDRDPVTSDPRAPQFGYPPDYYPNATDFAGAALIHLTAGEVFQATLTPEKRRYYPVKIGIANGASGMGAQVEVWKDGHAGPGFSLGYNDREGAVDGMLPDGNYVVKLTGQSGEKLLNGRTNLAVNGGPATGMMTLSAGTILNVRVNEEFGDSDTAQQIRQSEQAAQQAGNTNGVRRIEHKGYVQVTLVAQQDFDFERQYSAHASTDPDAEDLVIEGVPAGEFRVTASTPYGYVASLRCGGTDLMSSPLVVGGGASLPPIEVTVRDDGAEVDGSVVEIANRNHGHLTSGVVWPGAGFVYLLPVRENGQMRMVGIQPDGNFQTAQVPPGTYRVIALTKQDVDLEYRNEDAMRKYDGQMITVEPGQKEKIRVSLSGE